MAKVKEFFKENKIELLLVILTIIISANVILQKPLNNLDEVWNYNFARNIAENKIPYRDFNIVQLPGLFIIVGLLLKISNELIVTRILAIILSAGIVLSAYKLMKKLNIDKHIAAFASGFILYAICNHLSLDYNFFNLFLILIIMNLEFKEKNNNFIIGLFCGCSFLVKQTTGGLLIIATIIYKLIKDRKKINIKDIALRILGAFIPIVIFVLYLLINKAMYDFWDYVVMGMTTFSNKKSYLNLMQKNKLLIQALSIIIPAYLVGGTIWGLVKKDNYLLLILYGLVSFSVVYPIADDLHFLIGCVPAIIGIVYALYLTAYKMFKNNHIKKVLLFIKYASECGFYLLAIFTCCLGIYKFNGTINTINEKKSELAHFSYIPVDEKLENEIKKIDEYILKQDKNIYILDATAAIYMIPINRYNKDYDMFLKGNIGGAGEEGQINKVKNMKNTLLLIKKKKESRNWQTPSNVIEYIESNYEVINNIGAFNIYFLEE